MTRARTDITDRLRERAAYLERPSSDALLLDSAADEIDRLRDAVDLRLKSEWKIGYEQGYADGYRDWRNK